jgi:hypothetical protein
MCERSPTDFLNPDDQNNENIHTNHLLLQVSAFAFAFALRSGFFIHDVKKKNKK